MTIAVAAVEPLERSILRLDSALDGSKNTDAGSDMRTLTDGHDVLVGDANPNHIEGGAGEDVFVMAAGSDTIDGGEDRDIAYFDGEGEDYVFTVLESGDVKIYHLRPSDGASYRDTNLFLNLETYAFTDFQINDDELGGLRIIKGEESPNYDASGEVDADGKAIRFNILDDDRSNVIVGGDLDDFLSTGDRGNDVLIGNDGNDTIQFSPGSSAEANRANATRVLVGGNGTDTLLLQGSAVGLDVDISGASQRITTLNGVAAATLVGFENVIGSAHADAIRTDDGANGVLGGAGDDTIDGGGGDDTLNGGAGDDIMVIENGRAVVDGGEGEDTLEFDLTADGRATLGMNVDLATGTADDVGIGMTEKVDYAGIENVTGSDFDDTLSGDDTANTLYGRAGDVALTGLGGDDVLNGGAGLDRMAGGAGADVFDIAAASDREILLDFTLGEDIVNLTAFGVTFDGLDIVDEDRGARLTFDDGTMVRFLGVASSELTEDAFSSEEFV